MYCGETVDDEEDNKKIAALLPSISSSHITTSAYAYDEDTDDDIAPDPIQSTELKVKEEEKDTDDEVAHDPVRSAQVKEEEDLYGEDTDDEDGKITAAPSPITSANVKNEPINSYDMETDDEDSKLDAPSPVVSSQVNNKEDNSYDMDTDGEEEESDKESLDSSSRSITGKRKWEVEKEVNKDVSLNKELESRSRSSYQETKGHIPLEQKKLLEVDRSFWEQEKIAMEAEERGKKASEAKESRKKTIEAENRRKKRLELEKELMRLSRDVELEEEEEVVFVSCIKKKLTKEEEEKIRKRLAILQHEMLMHEKRIDWLMQHRQLIQQASHYGLYPSHIIGQQPNPIIHSGQYNQSIQPPQYHQEQQQLSEERRRCNEQLVKDADERRKNRLQLLESKKKVKDLTSRLGYSLVKDKRHPDVLARHVIEEGMDDNNKVSDSATSSDGNLSGNGIMQENTIHNNNGGNLKQQALDLATVTQQRVSMSPVRTSPDSGIPVMNELDLQAARSPQIGQVGAPPNNDNVNKTEDRKKMYKNHPGRHGDIRMRKAVGARQQNPKMSLMAALLHGGFIFPQLYTSGNKKSQVKDTEGVTVYQRKNQLNRRLREAKADKNKNNNERKKMRQAKREEQMERKRSRREAKQEEERKELLERERVKQMVQASRAIPHSISYLRPVQDKGHIANVHRKNLVNLLNPCPFGL